MIDCPLEENRRATSRDRRSKASAAFCFVFSLLALLDPVPSFPALCTSLGFSILAFVTTSISSPPSALVGYSNLKGSGPLSKSVSLSNTLTDNAQNLVSQPLSKRCKSLVFRSTSKFHHQLPPTLFPHLLHLPVFFPPSCLHLQPPSPLTSYFYLSLLSSNILWDFESTRHLERVATVKSGPQLTPTSLRRVDSQRTIISPNSTSLLHRHPL